MSVIEGARRIGSGIGAGGARFAYGTYDFAIDGGAVGTLPLRGQTVLPSGVILVDSLLIVDVVPTSGGAATIGISSEGASDIVAAAAISGAPWSTATPKRGTLNATAAPIRTTAQRTLSAVIGAFALTAGRFRVIVAYVDAA